MVGWCARDLPDWVFDRSTDHPSLLFSIQSKRLDFVREGKITHRNVCLLFLLHVSLDTRCISWMGYGIGISIISSLGRC